MARITKMVVQVTGLRELRRKLSEDALIAPPFHDAIEAAGNSLLSAAIAAAPVASATSTRTGGGTRSKFRVRMQAKPMPLWVRVETTQTRSSAGYRNYSYPKRVEWDPKLHHAGWLRGVLKRQLGPLESLLGVCARAIERTWSSA